MSKKSDWVVWCISQDFINLRHHTLGREVLYLGPTSFIELNNPNYEIVTILK
jgi:hypothetical protein